MRRRHLSLTPRVCAYVVNSERRRPMDRISFVKAGHMVVVGENSVPPPRPRGARALLARRDGWKSANRRPCARDAGRLWRLRAAVRPATAGVSSNLLVSCPGPAVGRTTHCRGRARAVRRVAVKLLPSCCAARALCLCGCGRAFSVCNSATSPGLRSMERRTRSIINVAVLLQAPVAFCIRTVRFRRMLPLHFLRRRQLPLRFLRMLQLSLVGDLYWISVRHSVAFLPYCMHASVDDARIILVQMTSTRPTEVKPRQKY